MSRLSVSSKRWIVGYENNVKSGESMKKVKYARRKVTQEQVNAMNRELELRGDGSHRYAVGSDGRLTEVEVIMYYSW
jgi:hypothetical protein